MNPEQQLLLSEGLKWTGYALEATAMIGLAVYLGNKYRKEVRNASGVNKALSQEQKSERFRRLGTYTTIAVLGLVLLGMCARR